MMTNFFQRSFEMQKNMFDEWQDYMKSSFKQFQSPAGEADNTANSSSEWFDKACANAEEFWSKVGKSSKSYQAIFELWKELAEKNETLDNKAALEIYDAWCKQHFGLLRDNLVPQLPDFMKDVAGRYVESLEASARVTNDCLKNWAANDAALQQAFCNALNKGPKGYIEYLEQWEKSYENTFGKLIGAPTFGKDMAFWQSQKSSFNSYIKYNIASTKFYMSLVEIARDATRKALDDYVAMRKEGTQPKTFDEFYKYWNKTVSKAYDKVLFSDEISVLAGNMVNEMSRFKMAYDNACEMWLANMPIPKKSDMNDLYRTVHEMKKELRALKRQIAAARPAE